jgi:hypothetical protein
VTTRKKSYLWRRPLTRLGWWAVGLGAAFVALFIIDNTLLIPAYQGAASARWLENLLPFYGIFMALCALAAGMVGMIALIRNHERSWLVWLALLPMAFTLFLILTVFLARR